MKKYSEAFTYRWVGLLVLASSIFLIGGMTKLTNRPTALSHQNTNMAQADSVPDLQNGLAKTPPMGWNSWNAFHTNINGKKIREIARAMVSSGMKAAGYKYIIIDDAWMDTVRDSHGRLQANPKKFPRGIKALASYIHSLGLKFGIYESAGTKTCAGYPGSLYHEKTDAETFAKWGVDYLKLDNCYNQGVGYIKRYAGMERALLATGRPIVFSICEWGIKDPYQWAPKISNLWRTTGDIQDNWHSVMTILNQQVGLYKYAGPGHWNDPDMLEVGNGGMTNTEYKAHFSLWAILAAPLISGNDLRHMTKATEQILTNRDVIAVDQDPAGIEGHRIADYGNEQIWVKPMADGSRAVVLLNTGKQTTFMTTSAEQIGMKKAHSYRVRNLWTHRSYTSDDLIRSWVPSHGVAMFRVWPNNQ